MAHSAYPELGESAIEALLDALERFGACRLPSDPLLGRCTMNIGTISGGRAPNVIPDAAKAEILVRLVGDPAPIREAFIRPWRHARELNEVLCIPPIDFDASMACRRPLFLSPRTCRCSARPGASRCCSGRAAFTWRTREERIAKNELWRRSEFTRSREETSGGS